MKWLTASRLQSAALLLAALLLALAPQDGACRAAVRRALDTLRLFGS
jgi:hypothetical protein